MGVWGTWFSVFIKHSGEPFLLREDVSKGTTYIEQSGGGGSYLGSLD